MDMPMCLYSNTLNGGCQVNRRRKPKKANLSGLEVVDYTKAYNGKRLKKEVYGIVSKDHAFIFKNVLDRKTNKNKPKVINDVTSLPNVAKEKIIKFFDDKKNSSKSKCYLIDK